MLGAKALWTLAKTFLGSPMGRAVVVLLAFLAWTGYQRHDAAQDAREAVRAEIEAATAAEHQRQLEAAQRVAEAARERATESEDRADAMEAERDAIIAELAGRETGDCDIPDDVRERLLRIGR